MKTWSVRRGLTMFWDDEVEIEAETEEEARRLAYDVEVDSYDAIGCNDVDINIEDVALIESDDDLDEDGEPLPYLPPKEQRVLAGMESFRPEWVTA